MEGLRAVKNAVLLYAFVLRVAKCFHVKIVQLKEEDFAVSFFPFAYQDALVQNGPFFFFFAEQDKIG